MKIVQYPDRKEWARLTERPQINDTQLQETVGRILDDVRRHGDEAVKRYEAKFDHAVLGSLVVGQAEIEAARAAVAPDLLDAMLLAHRNIATFHAAQRFDTRKIETAPGVTCWQKSIPIERVGLYVPGGTAPLFSTVFMLATPAKIAGCRETVLCSPPDATGKIADAILVAASIAGVDTIYKIGGAQAIGAMAYGTESVRRVYKIFGPGNRYVMAAKQQVSLRDVAIDMPAGPSEVCVIADESSCAEFVAADLLSQAEHGADSQVLLITPSEAMLTAVIGETERQLASLPRREIAQKALGNSCAVLVHSLQEAIQLSNAYAPEHLIVAVDRFDRIEHDIVNAGSVFLGSYACESAGDYASGTNHTLPTHGYARAYSGVNLDSYQRKITFQHLTPEGVQSIGPAVELMAENEQLEAHAAAMRIRMKQPKA